MPFLAWEIAQRHSLTCFILLGRREDHLPQLQNIANKEVGATAESILNNALDLPPNLFDWRKNSKSIRKDEDEEMVSLKLFQEKARYPRFQQKSNSKTKFTLIK